MERLDDIPYAPEHGVRGCGDLLLPDRPRGAPVALVIHGGGWNAMDKRGLMPVAVLMAECGYVAFAVNYRLLDQAPWPACGDDCVRAGTFLLNRSHPALRQAEASRLVVIGASAGGHLALWTGLQLPSERVRAIISIAGPADLARRRQGEEKREAFWRLFLGGEVTDAALRAASPINAVTASAPPLLCIHSVNDQLVRVEQSEAMVAAYRRVGAKAELFTFAGRGVQHGIWEENPSPVPVDRRVLVAAADRAIRDYLQRLPT